MGGRERASGLAAAASDLLLGSVCHGCGVPGRPLCPECRAAFGQRQPAPTRPSPCPPGFPPTVTSGPYDALAAALITAHKEDQALQLGRVLAGPLAGSVRELLRGTGAEPDQPVCLVPVPSAAAAVRRRGLDANWVLARLAARQLRGEGVDVRPARWLRQRDRRRDQAGLTAEQRHANLAGGLTGSWHAWLALRGSGSMRVVVVDDVVTSGASLTEAARALRVLGLEVIGAATVAATVRRRSSTVDEGPGRN